jgi:hypothetical protein
MYLVLVCRVCQKRPEVPDERYGRCESCAKAGRIAYRFRLAPRGATLAIKAGELSPRALKQKWAAALEKYAQLPATKPHLGLHEVEMVVAKDRLETVRVASDLATRNQEVMAALREAAARSDASW